ncbi:MAG TPA: hypothetical protein VG276_28640 [Actinomycetes bacterium]|jgi:hypothetical protein|nr:hypothetical protein [Actinomycetes bacterium]
MGVKGLGRVFDIGSVVVPVADLAAGANTGHRIHLKNYDGVCFVCYMGAVSAGTDTFVPDLQCHNAATGGTSQDLDTTTTWYHKSEATLDGDETWTKVTQAAASEVSLTGATYAALQMIVAFEVLGASLPDGFEWVSVDLPDAGAGGTRPGCILAIMFGLNVQRAPENLAQPNA